MVGDLLSESVALGLRRFMFRRMNGDATREVFHLRGECDMFGLEGSDLFNWFNWVRLLDFLAYLRPNTLEFGRFDTQTVRKVNDRGF